MHTAPPEVAFGLVATESEFKPTARSQISPTRFLNAHKARHTPLKNRIGKTPWPMARKR